MKYKKVRATFVIGEGNSISVLNDAKHLTSSVIDTEPYTAITNKYGESKEKR